MRRSIIVLAAASLLLSGVGAASLIVVPPIPEQLIEGHTVFATIETVKEGTREERFAAAVAVLVRERVANEKANRFPGVIWFNDQYLTGPTQSRSVRTTDRHPCTGAVIAVNRGDDLIVDQDLEGRYTLYGATYNESYSIVDPNDRTWIVDLWNTSSGRPAWTVAIKNNQAGYAKPDDGKCNSGPYSDGGRRDSPGDHGMGYPCQGCQALKYNAVLYFRLEHLDVAGQPKNHTERRGDDWTFDASGCHPSVTNHWRCPGDDDDREGNSHPYSPDNALVMRTGRDNHGGSAICDTETKDCHATRNILIFYGYVTPPVVRNYWLVETEGGDAPFHCHDDHSTCLPDDGYEAAGTDPVV